MFPAFDSMYGLFYLVPIKIMVVNIIIAAITIWAIARSIARYQADNRSPVITVQARIVAKRTSTRGSGNMNTMVTVSTYHYCTFELPNGERREFHVTEQT